MVINILGQENTVAHILSLFNILFKKFKMLKTVNKLILAHPKDYSYTFFFFEG